MKRFIVSVAIVALAAPLAFAIPQKNFVTNPAPPISIPDNNAAGASVFIDVPADPDGENNITDLNVDAIITHTWQGDLTIRITGPDLTSVVLTDRPGVPASTFGFSTDNYGNPTTGASFVWDDEATQGPYDAPVVAINNPTGSWRPENLLSAFDGHSKVGRWVLSVTDSAAGDTGSINQFSLSFTQTPEPASLALLGLAGLFLRRR